MSVSAPKAEDYLVDNYIEQKFNNNYGWLAPKGEFYPVEFAEHQYWAYKKAMELGYIEKDSCMTGEDGDILVKHGWVLLHNPSMGIAIVTRDHARPVTKAQREFLYDYYTERGLTKQANEYFKEG